MTLSLLLMLIPPLLGAAINGIFGRRFSQTMVSIIGCGVAGLSMIFALDAAVTFSHLLLSPAPYIHTYFPWIRSDNLIADFSLYYDRLTLVMPVPVRVVPFVIHLSSTAYMEDEGGLYRFFSYLNLFLFMMLLLTTAASYPLMF